MEIKISKNIKSLAVGAGFVLTTTIACGSILSMIGRTPFKTDTEEAYLVTTQDYVKYYWKSKDHTEVEEPKRTYLTEEQIRQIEAIVYDKGMTVITRTSVEDELTENNGVIKEQTIYQIPSQYPNIQEMYEDAFAEEINEYIDNIIMPIDNRVTRDTEVVTLHKDPTASEDLYWAKLTTTEVNRDQSIDVPKSKAEEKKDNGIFGGIVGLNMIAGTALVMTKRKK